MLIVSKNYWDLTRMFCLWSQSVSSHSVKDFGLGPTLRKKNILSPGISLTVLQKPSLKLVSLETREMSKLLQGDIQKVLVKICCPECTAPRFMPFQSLDLRS